jgi:hypothetical protein
MIRHESGVASLSRSQDRSSHAIAKEIFEKMSQDVSAISAQMILIVRDEETYKQFLACEGSVAQNILDLVQDVCLAIRCLISCG